MSLFRQLAHNRPTPLAMPILAYPGGRLIGASVRELVTDAARQVRAQAALRERYRTEVVLSAMDLSAEAEAFGCEILLAEGDPPTVVGRRVTNREGACDLPVPVPGAARTAVYLQTVRRLLELPGRPCVLGGMIGPFSLAGRLYGVSEALTLTVEDPDLLHALVEKSTQFLETYARAFKAAGAHGVVMAEPTAGLLSPRAMKAFSSDYITRLVAAVDDDTFTLIYHNCAAKPPHLPAILATGVKALHFGPPMDLGLALTQAGTSVVVCGNLDPTRVLLQGTPAEVRTAVRGLLTATRSHRHFVLSSGCDVPALAPPANLDAFFEEASQPAG
jgi:uroporphyrinogen decarboxylase